MDRVTYVGIFIANLFVLLVGEFNALAVLMRTPSAPANPRLLMATLAFALVALAITAAVVEPVADRVVADARHA